MKIVLRITKISAWPYASFTRQYDSK